jgi:hypothetical protein
MSYLAHLGEDHSLLIAACHVICSVTTQPFECDRYDTPPKQSNMMEVSLASISDIKLYKSCVTKGKRSLGRPLKR